VVLETFRATRRSLGTIAVVAAVSVVAGCGASGPSTSSDVDRFDANRAWMLVKRQVEVGQRPAGSPQLRRLALVLRRLLPNGSFERISGEPGLRNIVGVLHGREPPIVIGAHYDTLVKPKGFVGANNGAAGTAVVIEVAQALRSIPATSQSREVRFVLFDGEEPAGELPQDSATFYATGLRGSRAYAASHAEGTAAMILLDYVGHRGLHLTREASSTPWLWRRLVEAADVVGAERFFSLAVGPGILDDHVPFLRAGVPAVDLIDWNYPGQDLRDRLSRISRASLDGVGETVVQVAQELRSE
jgi:hypothetical protein